MTSNADLGARSCWDYPCRDDGCPFDSAADAPPDCPRTLEAALPPNDGSGA